MAPVMLNLEQANNHIAGLERRLEAFRLVLIIMLAPPFPLRSVEEGEGGITSGGAGNQPPDPRESTVQISRAFAAAVAGAMLFASSAGAAGPAAAEVTLTGRLTCALCVLKHKDVQAGTNVPVVPQEGKERVYGLPENQVTRAFEMEACGKALPVKVTAIVSEDGGKRVVAATKIERLSPVAMAV